jgi:hypothetical protein
MKRVLIILDGTVAKSLLDRLIQVDTSQSNYDIVYMNDRLLLDESPSNFTFYKLDPTSLSKLKLIMSKVLYSEILVVLANKDDTIAVAANIREINQNIYFTVYNQWLLEFNDKNIQNYNGVDILANGLVEKLPDVPVIAQNVGLKQGEIMEVKIPFGSSYAYRYIGSIAQKDWKISALYRNNILVPVKATLIVKPNDILLLIGKPIVLLQVYNAMSKSSGNFPMPFGKNIYVYIDLYLQEEAEAVSMLEKAKIIHQRMSKSELILIITRPTTVQVINKLKDSMREVKNKHIEIDYYKKHIKDTLKDDKKRFDIGLLVLSNTLLEQSYISQELMQARIPIFKVGSNPFHKIQTATVLLNNTAHYEQLSPIIFDIAAQMNFKINAIDCDPIGSEDRDLLVEHFENLSKIFHQTIKIDRNKKNPIRVLRQQKKIVQILPMRKNMFKKKILSFFNTDSDSLSYNLKYLNQILIPIIEDS